MKKKKYLFMCLAISFLWIALFSATAVAEERLMPNRLSSIGDSITVGMNAELLLENHYASWVNGYYGFWQWLFGLTNVNSHNQRITAEFGRWGRKNYMEAEAGATSLDFVTQAQKAVDHEATYVTVFLGHNDVCLVGDISELSDPYYEDFTTNVIAGLNKLKELPKDATIYIVGLADVSQIATAAEDKTGLFFLDCYTIWALLGELGFAPCPNMLAGKDTLMAVEKFNGILEAAVEDAKTDENHNYSYTDDIFSYGIAEIELSDIDCYHPSAYGQSVLSEITWITSDGPQF